MSFDLSRIRFDVRRDFLGVVMQQGRVQLDPALLHDHAEEVAADVEADAGKIEAHVWSLRIRGNCRRAGRPAGIPRAGCAG